MADGSTDSRKEAGSRPAAPATSTRVLIDAIDDVVNASRACGRVQLDLDAMCAEPDCDPSYWRDRWRKKSLEYLSAEQRLRDARMALLAVVSRMISEGART